MDKKAENKAEEEKQPSVYYDGDCPMCRAFVAGVTSNGDQASFKDARVTELPEEVSREQALYEIHFEDESGVVYKNVDAILRILERHQKWPLLVKLGKIKLLRPFLILGYRFVAINRYRLFGKSAWLFWVGCIAVLLVALLLVTCLSL